LSRVALALAAALFVVEATACVALVATTTDRGDAWTSIAFVTVISTAFVVSGLIALARRPDNRTGVYLAAVGYLGVLNGLAASENGWIFAFGFLVEGLLWVPFTALVLAFPTGQLQSRIERWLPIAAGVLLMAASTLLLLFDRTPAPPRCDECPETPVLVEELPRLTGVVEAATTVGALGLLAIAFTLLIRKWRAASPALRRLLWPVLASGAAAMVSICLVVIADEISDVATEWLQVLFLISFGTVPVAFLLGVLRTRLARSSVSDLVLALQAGTPLHEALADALRDPALEVVFRLDPARGLGGDGWIDPQGRTVKEPTAGPGRAVSFVEQKGDCVAALIHDASLLDEPELLDAVSAAAGLSLHNERLQAELRAEIRLTGVLADTAPSMLVNVDTDGRVLKLNPAALRASGYRADADVHGRYFWEVFIDDAERDEMVARFEAAKPDFPPNEYENTFTNVRGERVVVYWRSAPVLDDAGAVVSIVGAGIDVTDRHLLEEEKRREREFLYAIANHAPSLLCVVDGRGRVIQRRSDAREVSGSTNVAFERVLGYTNPETVGRVFWEHFVDPAEADEVKERILRVVAGGEPEEHDNVWITSSGERLHVAWTCAPLPRVDERTLFLISGSDVTERKWRELERERARDFLQAVVTTIPSLLAVVDYDARVTKNGINREFMKTFGWTIEEAVGRSFLELVHPDDEYAMRMAIAAAANGIPRTDLEARWQSSDESDEQVGVIAWTAAPTRDRDGQPRVLLSGIDITERKRQEEEIRASRTRLLGAESNARRQLERNLHDGAQQRLVALSVQLRLIEAKLRDPEAASELLAQARAELAQALEELRELARGIHPAVLTDRGLGPALASLVGRAPLPIELEAPAERLPPPVEAAAYYVVAEAVTNIVKYARASSAVVRVTRDNGVLAVTVSDDGVGGADPEAGSGLRGLVDRVSALDGTLRVESAPEGGTTVRAEIPIYEGALHTDAEQPTRSGHAGS
jgi:PAS domain S-box-containing protein